jgi:nucleoside-diphosphate-sugar epimerase
MSPALPALAQRDLDHVHALVGDRWQALSGKRLFLTGGTGFIGKWLLATLLDANHRLGLNCRVTVLTRDRKAFHGHAPQLAADRHVELVQGDVRSFDMPRGRFDLLIHAATDVTNPAAPFDTFDTCLQGTRRALEFAALAGTSRVLLVSSGAMYGRQPPTTPALAEDFNGAPDPLLPGNAYGQGKRAAEWLAVAMAEAHGLRLTIARCFAFVGPYLPLDRQFAIGNFMRDAMAGSPIVIQGDGTPWRSYLHAADMAAWLWTLAAQGRDRCAYNIGGEEAVTILQLAQRVVAALGSQSTITVQKAAQPGTPAERYVPDVRRILGELHLPAPIPLDDAIRRTAQWHRTHA